MNHWLMKSEPDVFSIDDLRQRGVAGWDGVRNYQARNFLRAMRKGDRAFFYHSSTQPPAIVGEMEVVREAYADPSQFDSKNDGYDAGAKREAPRWFQVDVKFRERFPRALTLEEIRNEPALQKMELIKRSRLSVQPVSEAEWNWIAAHCSKKNAAPSRK